MCNNNEILNEKFDDEFIHFETREICNDFLIYLSENEINYKYRCCGGLGCCITKNLITKNFVYEFKNKLIKKNIVNCDGDCYICMNENTNLLLNCKICNNYICVTCIENIKNSRFPNCPNCRSNV